MASTSGTDSGRVGPNVQPNWPPPSPPGTVENSRPTPPVVSLCCLVQSESGVLDTLNTFPGDNTSFWQCMTLSLVNVNLAEGCQLVGGTGI